MIISAALSGCGGFGSWRPAPVDEPAAAARPPAPQSALQAERAEALLQALLALGVDYQYGGASPVTGYDCSGLVAHVYREAWGLSLPHNTLALSHAGVAVSLAELQPGDLVFYDTQGHPYSHVGIYLGDGRFVHAPKTGARVRVDSLRNRYWAERFSGARRVEPPPSAARAL
ncbi:MAG TPA: C40 family peptidase [Burkholderiales bacterium]|nr:C40 family peptidase [Burkholderiales bacterium]